MDKCISCESVGLDKDAHHKVKLFGDLLPLCNDCYGEFIDGTLATISLSDEEYKD